MKLNWTRINATARKLQQAKQQAIEDATPPPPEPLPTIYDILNICLWQKVTYFIPIRNPDITPNLRQPTHFALLRMAGARMAHTRHHFSFWTIQHPINQVQEVLDTTPDFAQFTKPFIFHDKESAHVEIRRILNLHGQP